MFKLYVKKIHDQRLAHLYEHVIFDYVGGVLRKQKYIVGVDFYLIPQTSYDGLVTLSFEMLDAGVESAVEKALEGDIRAITDANIKRCVDQISCEKLSAIEYDPATVKKALQEAARQLWHDVFKSFSIDIGHPGRKGRNAPGKLFKFTKSADHFDHIMINYNYPGAQHEPVKLYIFDALMVVYQDLVRQCLADVGIAAYWAETSYHRDKEGARIVQELVVPAPASGIEKAFTPTLDTAFEKLWDLNLGERLTGLAHIYAEDARNNYILDTVFNLYDHMGVVVGAEDFKAGVTPEIVNELSDEVVVDIRLVEGKKA